MLVHIRLFSTLRPLLPPEARGATSLELPDGSSVADLLDHLGIADPVKLVTVNGTPETHRDRVLSDGDTVLVFPPVVGG
jgi:sulfur carrier protein ThiS